MRTGAGLVVGRLRGHEGIDAEVIERLVLSMGELKGIAMKMGQILSYMDTTLPPEARELLSILQVRSQPTSFVAIEATLREDFGARGEALLSALVREPVATASIGQVHRARLPSGVEVAVKALGVKKPDGPGFAVTLRLLRGFFEPVLKSGVHPMAAAVSLDVREVTRSKKSMMQLQLPGKLLFLFRIRFGLYAVLARLGAKLDWQAMEAEFSGRP